MSVFLRHALQKTFRPRTKNSKPPMDSIGSLEDSPSIKTTKPVPNNTEPTSAMPMRWTLVAVDDPLTRSPSALAAFVMTSGQRIFFCLSLVCWISVDEYLPLLDIPKIMQMNHFHLESFDRRRFARPRIPRRNTPQTAIQGKVYQIYQNIALSSSWCMAA